MYRSRHLRRSFTAILAVALPLVGHGTVRRQVMGTDVGRAATEEEISRMRALVRQGMLEGAPS